ncbi:hypothetical protein KJ059_15565 [Myxococcota bacterium]|nr:hypothetical protein [Myxococcota bacterium]MCZ7617599.1 hypothetical protein [Myxococcota bacterium]
MPDVILDPETYDRLQFAARVARISVPEVIRRLAREAAGPMDPTSADDVPCRSGWVQVFTGYQRQEVEAEFEPSSGRIRITSGNLEGELFDTPSAAAMAVIRDLKPDRMSPHTNGWRFWKDSRKRRPIGDLYERRR